MHVFNPVQVTAEQVINQARGRIFSEQHVLLSEVGVLLSERGERVRRPDRREGDSNPGLLTSPKNKPAF
jgi:hypothetical protein